MSAAIRRRLSRVDPVLGGVIAAAGPLELSGDPGSTPFRHLARAIAHQQLNGKAANSILRRFIELYRDASASDITAHEVARPCDVIGPAFDAPEARDAPFPTPAQVCATPDEALRGVGFSYSKIASLKDLASKALVGIVPDTATLQALSDDAIVERLTSVRGIGRWTVEMMLMFQLGRPDVLPVDDFGVRNGFRLAYGLRGMPRPRALAEYGEIWAPHRSAAAWYLWRACDLARVGRLPDPPKPAPRVAIVRPRAASVTKTKRASAYAAPRRRRGARTR